MNFEQCVMECARHPELIQQFDRLRGTNLQMKGAPIDLMVDQATGRLADDVSLFITFVYDVVWSRLPGMEV
jgi:hypothetical protein